MFGLDPLTLSVIGCVLLLLEVALFWAASALADAPPISAAKTFLVSLGTTAVWVAIAVGIALFSGLPANPLAPDHRYFTSIIAALALGVSWVVPAVLYVPFLSISIPRSLMLSLFQMLLRAFLYTLIIAVTMVVLASLQIYTGTEHRAELLLPPSSLLLR